MTTTSEAAAADEVLEARRARLESLLQIASRQWSLQLGFGEADRVGGGRIAMRVRPGEAMAASYLALKGGALHLLGHHLAGGEAALAAAVGEEESGKPHFVALWHALEDARLENGMERRWPGMARAFEARFLPALPGSLLRVAPLFQQVEIGLYWMGKGRSLEGLKETVVAELRECASWIAEAAQAEGAEASLAAMRAIYPEVAGLLRGAPRRGSRRALEDSSSEAGEGSQPPWPAQTDEGDRGAPEIELSDDLASVGVLGRRRELPEWYRPGSAPWFERGLGEKKIHPSARRPDEQTIVRPDPGDLRAYLTLWREVHREVGRLEDRLIHLLREETYLRYGGRFRSGKLHTAKLWKQRLGVYRLFERPVRAGRSIAFSVLVDESASMKGQEKSRLAAKAAILLGETLDHLDVPLEIIGYTTSEYEARAAMALGLTPAYEYRTMRCSALQHRIYKTFDEPYRAARARLSQIQPRHNNWDEESVLFASRRLRARREQTKVLLVISDGQPNGDADYLAQALTAAERSGCKVVGLGIGADFVGRIYRNAIVVESFRQMGEELLRLLARELRGGGHALASRAAASDWPGPAQGPQGAGSRSGGGPLVGWPRPAE